MSNLCSAFWKHVNIRPGNRVYPCCRFKNPLATYNNSLEDIIHSEEYKNIRSRNLKGEYIPECEKCYYEESIGHKSLRQEINKSYNTDSVQLEYLEIGFDNLCNLACDGCNSEFSTRWIVKEKEILGESLHPYMDVSDIDSIPSSLNHILFLGGEPLITKKHLRLLRLVKNPETVEITYNTNGSFIPDIEAETLFDQFKKVTFILSIDGYKDLNSQVRKYSDWNDVIEFINWANRKKFNLEFNTVLHINNMLGIEDLYNFINKQQYQKWYINMLTYPQNLDCKNANRDQIIDFLNKIKDLNLPNKDFIINHLQNDDTIVIAH